MCLEYDCFFTGDWAWSAEVWWRVVGANGLYCLVGIVKFVGGIPEMVPLRFNDLVQAFLATKWTPTQTPTLEKCKQDKVNGYALTNSEIFEYFGNKMEQAKNEYVDQNGPFASEEEEHKWELKTSKSQGHGVLSKTEFAVKVWVFDPFHAFVAINATTFCLFITVAWCVWLWGRKRLLSCVKFLDNNYIKRQVEQYIDSNKNRNDTKWMKLKINGQITREMIQSLPFFYAACTMVAEAIETKHNDDNSIQTLLICIFYKVTSLFHSAFGILWKIRFDVIDGEIPQELIDMKQQIRLATWLAIQCCPCMVCFVCFSELKFQ